MTERAKLIKRLKEHLDCENDYQGIADFVLADRKRVVKPLVKLKEKFYDEWNYTPIEKAIKQTLANAGIGESNAD